MTRQDLLFEPMSDLKTPKTPKAALPTTGELAQSLSKELKISVTPGQIRRMGRHLGVEYRRGFGYETRYSLSQVGAMRKILLSGGMRSLSTKARFERERQEKAPKTSKPLEKPAKPAEPKLSAAQKAKAQAQAQAMKAPVKKA